MDTRLTALERAHLTGEGEGEGEDEAAATLAVTRAVDRAHADWQRVFAALPTSKAAQMVKQMTTANADGPHSLTYGEICFFSIGAILDLAEPQPGEVFVDLGHGTGRAVIAAALLHSETLSCCRGIELLPQLVELSGVAQAAHAALVQQDAGALYDPRCRVELVCGDLTEVDVADPGCWVHGDVVFANSTCFTSELMGQLAMLAGKHLKLGSRMISLTTALDSPYLELVHERQYAMSWGAATAFVYRRVEGPGEA